MVGGARALETKGVHRRADRKSWKRWTRGRSNTIDGREEIPRERAGIAILSCSLSSGELDLILAWCARQLAQANENQPIPRKSRRGAISGSSRWEIYR